MYGTVRYPVSSTWFPSVMASVSFIGPLVSAESDKVSPHIWYLQARYVHPPEPRLGVVRLLPASSSRYSMCTVTLALINAIESACADQCNDLDKQTSGLHCLSLCDSPVSFLRVFTREQRRNWQGGKFLHENDDYYSHSSSNGNAIANAMHPTRGEFGHTFEAKPLKSEVEVKILHFPTCVLP